MKRECDSDICSECLQDKSGSEFSRYFLLNPTPKRKKCNACTGKNDKPFDKTNRASIEKAKSRPTKKRKREEGFCHAQK